MKEELDLTCWCCFRTFQLDTDTLVGDEAPLYCTECQQEMDEEESDDETND